MANDKNIRVIIPADFNKKLNLHLIDIRELGVKTTKAELIIRLAQIGLKFEQRGKVKTISDVAPLIRVDAPGLKYKKL